MMTEDEQQEHLKFVLIAMCSLANREYVKYNSTVYTMENLILTKAEQISKPIV